MKKCDMSVSPAHGVLTPCPEKAVNYIHLGSQSFVYLCEKHFKEMNVSNNQKPITENYIGENI